MKLLKRCLIAGLLIASTLLSSCGKDVVIQGSDSVSYVYGDSSGSGNGDNSNDGNTQNTSNGGTSGSNNSNGSGTTNPGDDKLTVTSLESLRGKTITYAAVTEKLFVPADEKIVDESSKKMDKFFEEIQKKYGFKLKFKQVPAVEMAQQLIVAINAGEKYADFMLAPLHQFNSMILNKAIRDLNQFPEFDLDNPELYNQSYLEQTRSYGKNLSASPAYLTIPGERLFFNKTLLKKEIGMEAAELYQMVRDGKWTMRKMQEMSNKAKKDLGGGGKSFKDQFGLCGVDFVGAVSSAVYLSAGGQSCVKNPSDGSYKYTFGSSSSLAALKTMQNWLLKDSSIYNIKDDKNNYENQIALFEQGRALFFAGTSYYLPYKKSNVEWGMIPFPKKDEKSEYRMPVSWNNFCIVIPANNKRDDIALAGMLLKEMLPKFAEIKEAGTKQEQEKIRQYDPVILEMEEKYINANAYLDPMYWGCTTAAMGSIHRIMRGADPAQDVKSINQVILKDVNNFNKALKDAR